MKTIKITTARNHKGDEVDAIEVRIWKDEIALLDSLLKQAYIYLPDLFLPDRHRIKSIRKIFQDFLVGKIGRIKELKKTAKKMKGVVNKYEKMEETKK